MEPLTNYLVDGVRVALMPPAMYDAFWPHIARELDTIEHLWSPWFTKEFLAAAPQNGIHVWTIGQNEVTEAVAYTQVLHYASTTVYQIMLVYGREFEKFIPAVEASFTKIAASFGCDEFEIIGRRGWKAKFKDCREVATVFRRKIPKFGVH